MLSPEHYRLRPLAAQDAEMLRAWRNQERIRAAMFTDHVIGEAEHLTWLTRALHDGTARYLIFELDYRPIGFVSFTGLQPQHGRASWAFYLGETDVPQGSGSAMEFFALDYAFGPLGLRKLCCEVFAFNASVVKLHKRFGFEQEALLRAHAIKAGKPEDVVALALFGERWRASRASLQTLCFAQRERQEA